MRVLLFNFLLILLVCPISAQFIHKSDYKTTNTKPILSAVDLYRQGLKYKNGDGVPINYTKAFQYFKTAADMGDAQSLYATAYCYYKGLGTGQNYQTAARLFSQGAYEGRDNSMYFYGLCFENGYGLTKNSDSAKYWLEKAAALGYTQAIQELKSPRGENSNDSAVTLLDKISKSTLADKKPLNEFIPVQPHIPSKELIKGTYNGYVLRYDWSGKYLISSKQIRISLEDVRDGEDKGNAIKGTWQEKGETAVPLQARLSEDSVIFKQTRYERRDHYSWDKAITYNFKSANLNLSQIGDSVYLSGNIEMFSPERNEPSKPVYLALVRSDAIASSLTDSIRAASDKDLKDSTGIAKIRGARLYPNPFRTSFTAQFILTESAKVAIQLLNMSGVVVYKKPEEFLKKGKYSILVSPGRIAGGIYIMRILNAHNNYTDLKAIKE